MLQQASVAEFVDIEVHMQSTDSKATGAIYQDFMMKTDTQQCNSALIQ